MTRAESLRHPTLRRSARQRGATLIVGLIMLVLLALIVVNAFTLSSSNLKAVGNMQVRDEAVAAANRAIELVTSSPFTDPPTAQSINVDLNQDGTTDYVVAVAVPTCVRATASASAAPSDVELGPGMSVGSTWNTDWEIDATVSDSATGASARVRQGVRVLLTQARVNAVCN